MARPELKKFYDSSAWKKQRLIALKRDKYTCQMPGCHRVATEVHHLDELEVEDLNNYEKLFSLNNLQSLCHDCHTRITKDMKCGVQNILKKIIFDENGYPIEIEN